MVIVEPKQTREKRGKVGFLPKRWTRAAIRKERNRGLNRKQQWVKFSGTTTTVSRQVKSKKGRQRQRLIDRYGLNCCWCGKVCDTSLQASCDLFPTIEHVIRKVDGGTDAMSNLRIACNLCNSNRKVHNGQPFTEDWLFDIIDDMRRKMDPEGLMTEDKKEMLLLEREMDLRRKMQKYAGK